MPLEIQLIQLARTVSSVWQETISSLEQLFSTEGKREYHLENSFSVKVKYYDSLGRIKREDGKTVVGLDMFQHRRRRIKEMKSVSRSFI